MSEKQNNSSKQGMERYFFRASAEDFKKIPGSPIAYWVSNKVRTVFKTLQPLSDVAKPRQGLATSDNNRFLKQWFEPSIKSIGFGCISRIESLRTKKRWFPCQKGGSFKKWYGNNDYVINWENDGKELLDFATKLYKSPTRTIKNMSFYFREGITWSTISNEFSMRYSPCGFISETKGAVCFTDSRDMLFWILGYTNSKLVNIFLKATSPTLDYHEGPIGKLPLNQIIQISVLNIGERCVNFSRQDWDSYETSWDFTHLPLLQPAAAQPVVQASSNDTLQSVVSDAELSKARPSYPIQLSLQQSYTRLRADWLASTLEMQRLETDNNRIFIAAYGLQDELTPDVPLSEITLTCNPHYRYGGSKTAAELEALLQTDTLREFVSYAVGCMFGRYSPDKPGLILANAGDTLADYLAKVPNPSFMPDDDNVIPLLDGDWFTDDITERFRSFLRVTFGEPNYPENLRFIEAALGKDLRKYFVKDFYADHVKRYKKRPIYWLFTSPKGTFSALIYLHRYRPDTASVVLRYLREFRTKLVARRAYLDQVSISSSASQAEKTKALKEIDTLKKQVLELGDYERDSLFPLASAQVTRPSPEKDHRAGCQG